MLKKWRWLTLLTILILYLSGCRKQVPSAQNTSYSSYPHTIQVWAHEGEPSEQENLKKQVEKFNTIQADLVIKIDFFDAETYQEKVDEAVISGNFPDVLDFDGPFLYEYIWKRVLLPLDDLISKEKRENLLPSIINQGTYREGTEDKLYSVGTFDSGLGIFGNRRTLEAAGVRIPINNEEAWTNDEFQTVLATLAQNDPDGKVLDLKLNYPEGEWWTYGFYPVLLSAGADLINREDYQSASGTLDSEVAVAAMEHVQSWVKNGYVDPNTHDDAFINDEVGLSWVGHWAYPDYAEAVGDDLVVLPLPDFGYGSKTAQGSWNWGITTSCRTPEDAMKFIEFLLEEKQVSTMTGANGAVPGTESAIAQSARYAKDGPLHLFADQLQNGQSTPRPKTPAYPAITEAFQKAVLSILRDQEDVEDALTDAAQNIDQHIQDNGGYQINTQ